MMAGGAPASGWWTGEVPTPTPEAAEPASLPLPRASQGVTVYAGPAEECVAHDLLPGAEYACAVTAVNVAGESPPSPPVHFTIPPPDGFDPDPSPGAAAAAAATTSLRATTADGADGAAAAPAAANASPVPAATAPEGPEALADAIARDALASLARARDTVADQKAREEWTRRQR